MALVRVRNSRRVSYSSLVDSELSFAARTIAVFVLAFALVIDLSLSNNAVVYPST